MRLMGMVLLVLLAAFPVRAGELAGVVLPDSVEVSGSRLALNGMALRRVVFFKVYVGGLYLPHAVSRAEEVFGVDGRRRMVLHFLRDVDSGDMSKAWMEGLEANTPDADAQVRDGFKTLCFWMRDVAEGDEMVVSYVPDQGTEIVLSGLRQGVVPGKAFADALFACWIGPKPGPGKAFRQGLLGG